MLSANFKPKRIAAASRGFLAIARLSCSTWQKYDAALECDQILRKIQSYSGGYSSYKIYMISDVNKTKMLRPRPRPKL